MINSSNTTLPLASIPKRMVAFVIDDVVIALLLFAIFYTQLFEITSHLTTPITAESIDIFKNEMNTFSIHNLIVILALKVMYHTFFVWQNGMTLGKHFMKIKVIDKNTMQKPTLMKAFLRALVRIVSEIFFYIGFLFAFFSPLRQTLHDKVTNCVVIDV